MILNQGGVLHYLGVHKTPRVLNSSCTTLNFLDVQTLQQFTVFIVLYFHVPNSSFFRAILRFETAPSIVISSIAVVTRGSIGRTISPVMRRCTEFAFHYSSGVFVFGFCCVHRWLCLLLHRRCYPSEWLVR